MQAKQFANFLWQVDVQPFPGKWDWITHNSYLRTFILLEHNSDLLHPTPTLLCCTPSLPTFIAEDVVPVVQDSFCSIGISCPWLCPLPGTPRLLNGRAAQEAEKSWRQAIPLSSLQIQKVVPYQLLWGKLTISQPKPGHTKYTYIHNYSIKQRF